MSQILPTEYADTVGKVTFVLLGWLLATLSPIIADAIRKKRRSAESRGVLLAELAELKYRLAIVTYSCERRYGVVDRTFLNWLSPIVCAYGGPMPAESVRNYIEMQLALTDEQLAQVVQNDRADDQTGLSLKKYPVPALDSRLTTIEALPTKVQPLLLEIHTQLGILDAEADIAQFYFRLTFDPKIEGENRNLVKGNLVESYRNYTFCARIIVDRISELEKAWRG